MDSHLKSIPGVGTLTARRLSSGDSEDLGGDSHGAASLITLILLLGSGDDLGAGGLERSDVSALEGESKVGKQIISQDCKNEANCDCIANQTNQCTREPLSVQPAKQLVT